MPLRLITTSRWLIPSSSNPLFLFIHFACSVRLSGLYASRMWASQGTLTVTAVPSGVLSQRRHVGAEMASDVKETGQSKKWVWLAGLRVNWWLIWCDRLKVLSKWKETREVSYVMWVRCERLHALGKWNGMRAWSPWLIVVHLLHDAQINSSVIVFCSFLFGALGTKKNPQ